ncbi:MAG: hypothetical protein L6Q57_05705 [Alphaproteobacteria bacterium]|nr:hypothetical protein [Alphaproteobacteria bacterium]
MKQNTGYPQLREIFPRFKTAEYLKSLFPKDENPLYFPFCHNIVTALCYKRLNNFIYITENAAVNLGQSKEALYDHALSNLRSTQTQEVSIECDRGPDFSSFIFTTADGHDSARLLTFAQHPDKLRSMLDIGKGQLMIACMPAQDSLTVISPRSATFIKTLSEQVQGDYRDAKRHLQLTPHPFLLGDDGIAQASWADVAAMCKGQSPLRAMNWVNTEPGDALQNPAIVESVWDQALKCDLRLN